jgi:hypothetical protein
MLMQVVLHLPESLAAKFNQVVPSLQQNEFLTNLLETALSESEYSFEKDPLYLAALAVEQDDALNAEMREWHDAFIGDGIREHVDGEIDATR